MTTVAFYLTSSNVSEAEEAADLATLTNLYVGISQTAEEEQAIMAELDPPGGPFYTYRVSVEKVEG